MDMLNISLSDAERSFVESQVAGGEFASEAAYVSALIRREHERQVLRDKLLEGAASPPAGPADKAYFDRLRARVARQGAQRA